MSGYFVFIHFLNIGYRVTFNSLESLINNKIMKLCTIISTINIDVFNQNLITNANYIFVNCDYNEDKYKSIYNRFFSIIEDFNKFSSLMKECRKEPDSYLVINSVSKNILFWYKTNPTKHPIEFII